MNLSVLCDVVNSINDHCKRLACDFEMSPMSYGVYFALSDANSGYKKGAIIDSELLTKPQRGDAMFVVSELVSAFHVGRARSLLR